MAGQEAERCAQFAQLEGCLYEALAGTCGRDVLPLLSTVLRVGQLRRERGDALQHKFDLLERSAAPACLPYL